MLDKNIIANTASTIWQPFGSSGKQVTTCNQSEPVKNIMCPFCHTMPQPQWPPKGTPQTTESQDMQRLPCNAAYVSTGSKAFNTTISKTTISTTRDYKESQGRNTKPRGCEGGPRQRPGTTEGTMFRVSLSITTTATTRIFRKWPSAAYNIAKILFKGKDEPQNHFRAPKELWNWCTPTPTESEFSGRKEDFFQQETSGRLLTLDIFQISQKGHGPDCFFVTYNACSMLHLAQAREIIHRNSKRSPTAPRNYTGSQQETPLPHKAGVAPTGSKVSKVSKASRNYVETVIFIRTNS